MVALLLGTAGTAFVEHFARYLSWYLAIFGSLTSAIFLGMALLAAFRYTRNAVRLRKQAAAVSLLSLPAVTILKPVHGMEPRLEENLESFFRQDYPEFEIIFGARNGEDQSLDVIAKLRAKYPNVRTRVVISGDPSWPNAKVFSLAKMMGSSDYSYFVISDSDVLVGSDFLRNVVPPLLQPNVGLVTCLYRGVPAI